MKLYTIREAAEALGTNKTAIRRLMKQIPPEELSAGSYRGQPTILISQKGFETLVSLQAERQEEQEAQQEAERSDSEGNITDSSALISELRSRIEAQDQEIQAKNEQISRLTTALEKAQEATAAAQALHAATAEQLRLLTAHEEEAQQKESFADRLRHLFRGR